MSKNPPQILPNKMPFFKRKKGSMTKVTKKSLASIIEAFDRMGEDDGLSGTEFFTQWAKENPTEFYKTFWVKLIPRISEPNDHDNKSNVTNKLLILPPPTDNSYEKVVELANQVIDHPENDESPETSESDNLDNNSHDTE